LLYNKDRKTTTRRRNNRNALEKKYCNKNSFQKGKKVVALSLFCFEIMAFAYLSMIPKEAFRNNNNGVIQLHEDSICKKFLFYCQLVIQKSKELKTHCCLPCFICSTKNQILFIHVNSILCLH
jgi:hypothetical protein